MDELLAGPAKKKIILAGSSVMQLGALLQSNENSIFGLFFTKSLLLRLDGTWNSTLTAACVCIWGAIVVWPGMLFPNSRGIKAFNMVYT